MIFANVDPMAKKKIPNLSRQIEREVIPEADTLDPDLLSFVASFLEECSRMPRMEPMDLLTPESARRALVQLEARHSDLTSRLKTGRALKQLLEEKRRGQQ